MSAETLETSWGWMCRYTKMMPGQMELPVPHKWAIEVRGHGNTEQEARDNMEEALCFFVGATMLRK